MEADASSDENSAKLPEESNGDDAKKERDLACTLPDMVTLILRNVHAET